MQQYQFTLSFISKWRYHNLHVMILHYMYNSLHIQCMTKALLLCQIEQLLQQSKFENRLIVAKKLWRHSFMNVRQRKHFALNGIEALALFRISIKARSYMKNKHAMHSDNLCFAESHMQKQFLCFGICFPKQIMVQQGLHVYEITVKYYNKLDQLAIHEELLKSCSFKKLFPSQVVWQFLRKQFRA